jgi:hypothetical protein
MLKNLCLFQSKILVSPPQKRRAMSAEAIGDIGEASFPEMELEEVGSLEGRSVRPCGRECFNIGSLTAVSARELLSSRWFFSPPYKERRIEDKGSICASLSATPIDIFQREEEEENWAVAILRGLARGVAALAVGLFCAVAGVCYHLRLLEHHFQVD